MLVNGEEITAGKFFRDIESWDIEHPEDPTGYAKTGDPTVGYRFMYKAAANGVLYPPLFGNRAWLEYSIANNIEYEGKNFPFYEGQVNHVPKGTNDQGGVFFFRGLHQSLDYFKEELLGHTEAVLGEKQELFTYESTTSYSNFQEWDKQYRSRILGGQEYNEYSGKWFTVAPEGYSEEKEDDGWEAHRRVTTVGQVNKMGSFNLYRVEGTYKGQHGMEWGEIINDFYIPTEPLISISVAELHKYFRRKNPDIYKK